MNKNDIQDTLLELQGETASLSDPKSQDILKGLFNLIDQLYSDNEALRKENQQLKDEINCLKGEQGKPDIKKNTQQTDHSSEQERKESDESEQTTTKKKRQRKSKLAQVKIDREQICPIDKSILPEDAQRKGYSDLVIQDIKIVTDNVKYQYFPIKK